MPFDPCLLLNLSSSLFQDDKYDEEAKYRTSISRAYYAAFLISRTYLESKGWYFDPAGTVHKEVISHMKKDSTLVGTLLFKLRQDRNDADYNLDKKVEQGITRRSIKYAQQVLEEVNKL